MESMTLSGKSSWRRIQTRLRTDSNQEFLESMNR